MSNSSRSATVEWKWRRREAIIRDDYACQECGAFGGPEGDAELHVHHETPVAEGGSDDLANLTTLCKPCHMDRHRSEESGQGKCAESLNNPHRDEESGQYTETYPTEDFLEAIDNTDSMAGTQDVADAVGCSYETAYKKLRQLEDTGAVNSQKVANARVWLPADE